MSSNILLTIAGKNISQPLLTQANHSSHMCVDEKDVFCDTLPVYRYVYPGHIIVNELVPNSVDAQVGSNVRRKRIELGSYEVQMAGFMSITLDEYIDCESGKRRFGAISLLKLIRLLNVSADYFFEGLFSEAYPVDSGTSICGRLGGKAFALGFLGFSRLMMSQYVVGTWLEARPSRVSNDAWR